MLMGARRKQHSSAFVSNYLLMNRGCPQSASSIPNSSFIHFKLRRHSKMFGWDSEPECFRAGEGHKTFYISFLLQSQIQVSSNKIKQKTIDLKLRKTGFCYFSSKYRV